MIRRSRKLLTMLTTPVTPRTGGRPTGLRRRSLSTVAAVLIVAVTAATAPARAADPAPQDAAARRLALEKLSVLGSVLYIAAHPDDENTAMLATLSKGRLLRTGYLALTRGDGGQNLIGTEQGAALGLVRSEELLAARRIDGAEQFFTRAIDFGYSKSADESLRLWGHDAVLSDVVWVIRSFRPDVIVTRFPPDARAGHGHHTASAMLAIEAFKAAADPLRFPEQLAYVKPWQVKRVLWNAWRPRGGDAGEPAEPALTIDLGAYNPLLGESYSELAARARSMHKTQGFGSSPRRGPLPNSLQLLAGDPPDHDLMDGVDTTWRRVPGGETVEAALARARADLDPEHPERILPDLVAARRAMGALGDDPWIAVKRRDLDALIRACLGLWLDATSEARTTVPGATVTVTATAVNRSPADVTLVALDPDDGTRLEVNAPLADNQPLERALTLAIPSDAAPTQPYWLVEPPRHDLYTVTDQRLIGRPETPAPLAVRMVVRVDGEEIPYRVPVVSRWTDPVAGEQVEDLEIRPPVTLALDRAVELFGDRRARDVGVVVHAHADGETGTVRLTAPAGWTIEPASAPFALAHAGDETRVAFRIGPPAEPSTGTLTAIATVGGREMRWGFATVSYPHIGTHTMLPPAEATLDRVDLETFGKRIGYVMGPGDEVPDALRQMGYAVDLLSDDDLAGAKLDRWDAIVVGVRAYDTRPALAAAHDRLMDYVRGGGVVVVQYNTTRGLITPDIGPYPFELSHDRVTDETAAVTFAVPGSPLLTTPNRITDDDFAGWVQERGLYYPSSWDPRYEAPLSMADPGEKPTAGALLDVALGRGRFVYTGLSFFRQLPAGVPGAYRLFANLIAGGRHAR